jgi:hypothetical protein
MFKVGQKVVCVDINGAGRYPGYTYPELKTVYTVRELFNCPRHGHLCMLLVEIINEARAGLEPGFGAHRFRPVVDRTTDISIFNRILDDVNAGRVREIA